MFRANQPDFKIHNAQQFERHCWRARKQYAMRLDPHVVFQTQTQGTDGDELLLTLAGISMMQQQVRQREPQLVPSAQTHRKMLRSTGLM